MAGAGALKGEAGDSAYEIAQKFGFTGTEQEWIESLSDYNQLNNTPDIPDKISELDNDLGYITLNNLSDYAKKDEIPTSISQLTGDIDTFVEQVVNNIDADDLAESLSSIPPEKINTLFQQEEE